MGQEPILVRSRIILAVLLLAFVIRMILLYIRLSQGNVVYSFQYETFDDFNGYYLKWFQSLGSGLLPYRDFFYQYPPLFLYLLYPLYELLGMLGPALAMSVADAGSAALVYLIVRRFSSEDSAVLAGSAYALSPFVLLYQGYLLFSTEPMLFFLLWAVYLLQQNRVSASAGALAIAVLLRQEAIFLLPLYFLYSRKHKLMTLVDGAVKFLAIVLAASLPFVILAPHQYLGSLIYNSPSAVVHVGTVSQSSSVCRITQNLSIVSERCTVNGSTTTIINSVPLSYDLGLFMNTVSQAVAVPIAILSFVGLYTVRRRLNFHLYLAAFLIAFSILLFGIPTSHPIYRYYYLPFYALVLTASYRWQLVLFPIGAGMVSLALPPGAVQELIPFLLLLAMFGLQDYLDSRAKTLPGEMEPIDLAKPVGGRAGFHGGG